jgi:hypothetical protein
VKLDKKKKEEKDTFDHRSVFLCENTMALTGCEISFFAKVEGLSSSYTKQLLEGE